MKDINDKEVCIGDKCKVYVTTIDVFKGKETREFMGKVQWRQKSFCCVLKRDKDGKEMALEDHYKFEII